MPLSFVTGNAGKFREVRAMLPDAEQLDMDLPEIQETDPHAIISAKIAEVFRHHSGPFIVEDTSLLFDCLGGLPGPLIKWFLVAMGNEGLHRITERMGDDGAEAVTVIGYAASPDAVRFFEGRVRGRIVSPRGSATFGWNPVFQPNGWEKTFGEMSPEEKNSMSMRRLAVDGLKTYLASHPA